MNEIKTQERLDLEKRIADVTEMSRLAKLDTLELKRIDLLGKGYIEIVDWMCNDSDLATTARVSYQDKDFKRSNDANLLSRLIRNEHTSPIEQGEIRFQVKAPIFVILQWLRHRTSQFSCISGDSKLWFDEPHALLKGKRKRRSISLKELFIKWNNKSISESKAIRKDSYIEYIDPEKEYSVYELSKIVHRKDVDLRTLIREGRLIAIENKSVKYNKYKVLGKEWINYCNSKKILSIDNQQRYRDMKLRHCNEDTGEIIPTNIKSIWESGIKPVYEVILENGYKIKTTKDHQYLSESGWGTLESISNMQLKENEIINWDINASRISVNGVFAYTDKEYLEKQKSLGKSMVEIAKESGGNYHTIKKYFKKFGLKYSSEEKGIISTKAQTGKKKNILKKRKPYTPEQLEAIRKRQGGSNSRFWKGGISSERALIGTWTRNKSKHIFKRDSYKCQICLSSHKLNAHHIDPVANNIDKAYDENNLLTLCSKCHIKIHANHLELEFLDLFNNKGDILKFWDKFQGVKLIEPKFKQKFRKPKKVKILKDKTEYASHKKIIRTYSKIKSIKYIGMEMTYDIEVNSNYHNFVCEGFIVHNSFNSESGRYSELKDEFYLPDLDRIREQSKTNMQGSGIQIDPETAQQIIDTMKDEQNILINNYKGYLVEDLTRELARINIPLSNFMTFVWKIDLHNLFNFLRLRMEEDAQWEIRQYANAIEEIINPIFPMAMKYFHEHIFNAKKISKTEFEIIKQLINEYSEHLKDNYKETYKGENPLKVIAENNGLKSTRLNDFLNLFN